MKKSRIEFFYKYRFLILIILFVIIIIALFPKFSKITVSDIIKYTPESLPLAALALLGIYCIKSVVMVIPMIILYVSAGILFPIGWAIGISYICIICELTIGYVIGMLTGKEKIEKLINKQEKIKNFFSTKKLNSYTTCFISRLLPLPCDMLNMLYGASGIPYSSYLIFSLLGLSPVMIPYVIAGRAITTPLSPEFLIPFGISLTLTFIMFIIFQKIVKRKKMK